MSCHRSINSDAVHDTMRRAMLLLIRMPWRMGRDSVEAEEHYYRTHVLQWSRHYDAMVKIINIRVAGCELGSIAERQNWF